MSIQDFGEKFSLEDFYRARDVAREITYELSSKITPGMNEAQGHQLFKELCLKHEVQKSWHPPKIRFGPNTLLSFKEVSEPYVLLEDDIYFLDIGPVLNNHEADFGQTFTLGSTFDHKHIADSSIKVFDEVSEYFRHTKVQGPELYDFATKRAQEYGYDLSMGSDGHRIGDFPHHVFFKGAIIECDETLVPHAWILEIHLIHKDRKYGAFFEDVLR